MPKILTIIRNAVILVSCFMGNILYAAIQVRMLVDPHLIYKIEVVGEEAKILEKAFGLAEGEERMFTRGPNWDRFAMKFRIQQHRFLVSSEKGANVPYRVVTIEVPKRWTTRTADFYQFQIGRGFSEDLFLGMKNILASYNRGWNLYRIVDAGDLHIEMAKKNKIPAFSGTIDLRVDASSR